VEIIPVEIAKKASYKIHKKKNKVYFEEIIESFNNKIREETNKGEMSCIFFWEDLLLDPIFFNEENHTGEIMNLILDAGYSLDFIYKSVSDSSPCGIVVSWSAQEDVELQYRIEKARSEGCSVFRSDEF
jgi:hypothetical protein